MSTRFHRNSHFISKSSWGSRIDPIVKGTKFHSGSDYAAKAGTPIPTEIAGKVVYSGFNDNLGNTVIVKHHDGGYSLYGHMQHGDRVKVGQPVWPGEIIGRVGSTGARSTGPHVHYTLIDRKVKLPEARTGGPIGVALNVNTTIDPNRFDVDPRYLNETLRAQQMMGAESFPGDTRTGDSSKESFGDRIESVNAWPPGWSIPRPLGGLPALIAEIAGDQEAASDKTRTGSSSVFVSGARAVPFAPANPLVPDESDPSFEERFRPALPIRRLSSRLPSR